MGKHLLSSDKSTVQIEGNDNPGPGCMWGILHILDYHHWHVKRVSHHRRHARYKRKTILHNQGEDQQYGAAEAEPLVVGQNSKKLSAKGNSTPKNSKKGQSTEESQHLESSDKSVQCKACRTMDSSGQTRASSEYALHLEKDGRTTEASLNQTTRMETIKLNRDISNKIKKHSDVMEIFSVEKDLLLKFLRDLDVGKKLFHQASHNKARLTKSGSFPLTKSSKMRSISTRTFKHKQTEIWAFPKGDSFVKDISYEKPMPLVSDLGVDSAMKQEPIISSRSSQGWNHLVIHRFKLIKQKIKHALVEAIQHRASPEYSITDDEKEVSQILGDGMIKEYKKNGSSNEIKASDYDSNKHEVRLIRRTSSLNESLDRYTQLFEKSFSKDVKWHSSKSKSLRLTNEDKIPKSGNAPKFSRSNLSLPNFESLGFILHEALLDTNDVGDTAETDDHVQRKSASFPLQTDKSLDQINETEMAETVEGGGRDVNPRPLSGKIVEKIDGGVTCDQREDMHEISMTIHPSKEVMASFETSCEDNTTSHAEGEELNTRSSSMEELETDLAKGGSVNSFADSLSNTSASVTSRDTNKNPDNHFLLHKSVSDNDSNFKYVKNILELSGFMGNEEIQMWHTVDQPLKPSLLMELDHEMDSSGKEIVIVPYDHQLLFNLVNEVLLEIYEMSPTYFPRPFSFNHRLRPTPKGHYLLNAVWDSVNSYLSLRPELDQTLDDVVGRDLAKRSGWMNLQHEEEYVALELEEMIVGDLLDEIIFS